jgi:high-affinity iron transporter
LSDADTALTHFIEIWPYVEGQIQTKDGALYTKIEDKIAITMANNLFNLVI